MKLRLGVIGCGRISHSHLQAVQALPERVELTGVADPLIERASAAQTDYGAKNLYSSAKEILQNEQIEAVILCLPHDLHHPVALEALSSGKHVLVEKPMALTADQADEMIAVAKENDRKLMVAQSRRFSDAVMQSKKLIEEGEIGELIHVFVSHLGSTGPSQTSWWPSAERTGGYGIPLWGSHIVDYILWVYESKPVRVYVEALTNHPEWHEGEDEVAALMSFENEGMATVHMSWNLPRSSQQGIKGGPWGRYERVIVGTRGAMWVIGETDLVLNNETVPVDVQPYSYNFVLQLKEFADSIREDREPLTSGSRVRDSVEVLDAMRASARENRAVYLG